MYLLLAKVAKKYFRKKWKWLCVGCHLSLALFFQASLFRLSRSFDIVCVCCLFYCIALVILYPGECVDCYYHCCRCCCCCCYFILNNFFSSYSSFRLSNQHIAIICDINFCSVIITRHLNDGIVEEWKCHYRCKCVYRRLLFASHAVAVFLFYFFFVSEIFIYFVKWRILKREQFLYICYPS